MSDRVDSAGTVAVVVPRRPSRTAAVDSQLMAAAALAQGFEELVGVHNVLLLTETGETTPQDLIESSVHGSRAGMRRGRLRWLPSHARLAVGDLQAFTRARRMREVSTNRPLRLVVQYHHRFQDLGWRLAQRAGCPLVLRVEALEIEEQRAWGLRGAHGGRLVAAFAEHRLLRRADVVSAVSEPLTGRLRALGVSDDRLVTLPNGIDLDRFRPVPPVAEAAIVRHGLSGRFLLGWVGSFRAYHGLTRVDALLTRLEERLPDATLCMVGAGPLRAQLEQIAARHPHSLRLIPPVPHSEVPAWLCRFDVCLQIAEPGAGEHYSPLKVLEYLACGRPVVAPDFSTSDTLSDGRTALLYPVDDVDALVAAVALVHDDPNVRARLSASGRSTVERRGSWTAVAARLLDAATATTPALTGSL